MKVTAERYLSLQEVGDELGVSDQTVRRWVKAGELTAYKPGKEYRIKDSDLEEFLQTREVGPKGQAPRPLEEAGLQRRDIYSPWLEFVNRYADRWGEKITAKALDEGEVNEFAYTLKDLMPVLAELGTEEKNEQPASYPYSFGPVMDKAVTRIEGLLDHLIAANADREKIVNLEPLIRAREELKIDTQRQKAASG